MKKINLAIMVLFLFVSTAWGQGDSLEQYLRKTNPDLREMQLKKDTLINSLGIEADLITSPQLFSNINYIYSKKRSDSPLAINDNSTLGTFDIGVQKVNLNGSFYKFGHNISHYNIENSQYLKVSDFSYTEPKNAESFSGSPYVSFGLPLLTGFGGLLIKKDTDVIKAQDKLEIMGLEVEVLQKETELKNLIWNFSLKKKLTDFYLTSQSRIQKLYNIVKRKVDSKIEEPGSLFQIEALLKSNEVEILILKKDLLALEDQLKQEGLSNHELFSSDLMKSEIDSSDSNDEIYSYASALRLIELDLKMAINDKTNEQTNHRLDLIFKASLESDERNYSRAIGNSFSPKRPEYAVGLSFTMELDRGLLMKKREKSQMVNSNNQNLAKIIKGNDNQAKLTLLKKKENELIILKSLEKLRNIQKDKLQNEMRLLSLGRSNLFQVLQFESEYIRSEQSYYYQILTTQNTTDQLIQYRFKI